MSADQALIVIPKKWWRSKLLWTAGLTVLAGLGTVQLPGKVGSAVAVFSGVAVALLRLQTAAPISGTPAASGDK